MKKRQAAIDESYEAQWDGGRGSHHPDYDPTADGSDVVKATRETEELLMAIIKVRGEAPLRARGVRCETKCPPPARWPRPTQNDIRLVYKKIEEGADVNFVFGKAYGACSATSPRGNRSYAPPDGSSVLCPRRMPGGLYSSDVRSAPGEA